MCDKEEQEKSLDIVSDQEKEHAQNALNEFNKGNYTSCLQNLNKLDNRPFDFKVAHNKAVGEYYKSDLKKLDNFQKSIKSIFHQFHMRLEKLDDVDHCAAYFNQALLMYHQKQYTSALRVIDKVYKFIEPMDETLARQVGLLAIELKLCIRQPDKALCLITYLENQIVHGCNANIKTTLKISRPNEKEQKEKKITPLPISPANELFLKKLAKYRIKCHLLNHSLNIAQKEIQTLLSQDKQNIETMFMYANIEYLKGNFDAAIKILTSIPNECIKYSECGESSTVLFYNNMGAIHHAMGKPNLACHYFQKALKEDVALTTNSKKDNGDKPLYTIGSSKYHEIIYNLGISLLHAGRPHQAFDCLIIAVRRYHRNSRLWLRIAECCILAHKESNEIDFNLQKLHKELIVEYIGSQESSRIILTSNLSKDKKYSSDSQTYAVPVATIEFASLCLRNALLLLPSDTTVHPVQLLLIPGVSPPDPPPSPGPAPSSPLSIDSIISLRNAILVASSYVSLCLGDYILALEHAQTLLIQPRASETHKLLAHLYAAEALVLLDKMPEALEHLNIEKLKDLSFNLPPEDPSSPLKDEIPVKTNPPAKWFPTSKASVIAVMQYNIAVAKAIQGQLEQAGSILQKIWQMKTACPVPAHVIMLVIYIELKLGRAESAKAIIRQYALQQRVSG